MSELSRNRYGRRRFLKEAALGAAALAASPRVFGIGETRSGTAKPNVVYMFSDEHRWHSMSFTETPAVRTPHMAALSRQGVSFTNCISNYPVCSPHRAILMTGRWPYQQKMLNASPGMIDNGLPLSPDQMTIGKAFKDAGYATGYVGKWHLGGGRAEPFGFDMSLIWSKTNNHWDSVYHPKDGPPVRSTRYNATHMTDQALDFIEANKARPFFLMLSPNPPHAIFTDPPEDKRALYPDTNALPFRKNAPQEVRDRWWPAYQGYHAHVTAIDEELGRVMTKLDELDLADNTILVYSSDHGSMMGSHRMGNKRHPQEESIRTPFIVRWPETVPTGVTADVLFGSIDIMPSMCALAGLTVPDACQGLDFSPTMRGEEGPQPESQFIMHIDKDPRRGADRYACFFRGVKTDRYTYSIRAKGQYHEKGLWQLFDNKKDPYQLNNRIDDPELAGVRRQLHEMTAQWVKRADDPFVVPELPGDRGESG